jgi:tetratricopeptide (TPR) repeat protein
MSTIPRAVIVSVVAVIVTGGAGAARADDRAAESSATTTGRGASGIVCLGAQAPEPKTNGERTDGGLLLRELLRQAVLIAARDEMGLRTRDMALREPFSSPASGGNTVLTIRTCVSIGRSVDVQIGRAGAENEGGFWSARRPLREGEQVDPAQLLMLAEELSRGDFVDGLAAFGLRGTPNRRTPAAGVPASAEEKLQQMSFLAQFAAVRELHSTIRRQGESPALLGALVRGYANLGQLTRFLWAVSPKVFRARALVYAQRMVAEDPESPWPLWHRAYAHAMAGIHVYALDDLAAAGRLAAPTTEPSHDARGDALRQPEWVALIDAYCRYDMARLDAFAGVEGATGLATTAAGNGEVGHALSEGYVPLARLLRMAALEYSLSDHAVMAAGQAVTAVSPDCFRAYDLMCEVGGIGNHAWATETAEQTLAEVLPARLCAMPDAPEPVRQFLVGEGEGGGERGSKPGWLGKMLGAGRRKSPSSYSEDPVAGEAGVVRGLLEACPEDRGEPSWGVLARLLEDVTFMHVDRHTSLVAEGWRLPASEVAAFIQEVLPRVANHPYRAWIESYRFDLDRDRKQLAELARGIKITDPQVNMVPLIARVWHWEADENGAGHRAWKRVFYYSDWLSHDFEDRMLAQRESDKPRLARRLLTVSPYSPVARAELIKTDWAYASQYAEQWANEHPRHPAVLAALGKRYFVLRQDKDAQRILRRYVELAPDSWAYRLLAETYWRQGEVDAWLATLHESLDRVPPLGLENAVLRVGIAERLMQKGLYDRALPYAEGGAQTGAAWAMLCASQCHEGLGNWDTAEQLVKGAASRYDERGLAWYAWCKRTGRGDIAGARQLALRYVGGIRDRASALDKERMGVFYLLEGDKDRALALFREAVDATASPYAGLHAALLAYESGDVGTRDAILKVIRRSRTERETTDDVPVGMLADLAALFGDYLAQDTRVSGYAGLDALMRGVPERVRPTLEYFTGRFLELYGDKAAGEKYLLRAADSPSTSQLGCALARDLLRSRGVPLRDIPPRPSEISEGIFGELMRRL